MFGGVGEHPPAASADNMYMITIGRRTGHIYRRYISIHGPLLAKGLSFSILFASIPLLFLLTTAGSVALTPHVLQMIEAQLFRVLPDTTRRSIIVGLETFARRPGSLSFLTVGVFLFAVHTLFYDVYRVVRAAFGKDVSPARGRARALLANAVFLLLIYVSALATLAGRVAAPYLVLPTALVVLMTRAGALVIIAAVLWSLIRVATGERINARAAAIPAITGAFAWQLLSWLAGLVVRGVGRRLVVYGVLASAVLYLLLMRVYAEILLHTALWTHELSTDGDGTDT